MHLLSLSVLDNPEFRALITYVGHAAGLEDGDLPHRTKVQSSLKSALQELELGCRLEYVDILL